MQFLEDSVTDWFKPFRDSDIMVKRRWYPVPDGTPLLPFPTVMNSIHYVFQKWEKSGPGEVWGEPVSFPRVGTPPGLTYDHICGTEEDFLLGAVFDPDADVEYDDEWIPLCCGRESVCTTQLCATDPVNGLSAAQLWSYPVPHQDSNAATPVWLFQRAFNEGNTTPFSPGAVNAWYPAGVAGLPGWSDVMVANNARVMQYREWTFRRAADEAITQRLDSDGWALNVEKGGDVGSFTARIVAGVLELCGVNAQICLDLLPPLVALQTFGQPVPAGTNLATATLLTASDNVLQAAATGTGVKLPNGDFGTSPVMSVNNGNSLTTHRMYAGDASAQIYDPNGSANLLHIDLPPRTVIVLRNTNPGRWTVLRMYTYIGGSPPPAGTVTSVDIGTSSAGLSVGGGPITAAGTLTVDLDSALEDLLAVSMTTDLFTGDGAGSWAPVTIGDWLSFSGGTLDVVPPTATQGQTVATAFSITAAAGTAQATGITISLPAAGTYLITGRIRGNLQLSAAANGNIVSQLRDNTAAALIANTETLVVFGTANGVLYQACASLTHIVTVTVASTIEIYATRNGTTFTTSDVGSNANGRTVLDYVRLF